MLTNPKPRWTAVSVVWGKAPAVILDPQHDPVVVIGKAPVRHCGTGMFRDISQRFLRDTEETFSQMPVQWPLVFFQSQVDRNVFPLLEFLARTRSVAMPRSSRTEG